MENKEQAATRNDDLVIIARAVKTKGLQGEVVADLLTDFPDRFANIDQLFAISPAGERITVALENSSLQHGRVVLKLSGYDAVEAAKTLIGYDFAVPETDAVQLEADEYFDWQLEGCSVHTTTGLDVGKVSGIMRTGGVSLLEVDAGDAVKLVPMAASILVSVDPHNRVVIIDPPEGLLDL